MNFLITGGASGLGYAITKAVALHYPESKVYFTFFSSGAGKEQLEKEYKNTTGIQCNFLQEADINNLIELIKTSQVDVLVNNAVTGLKKQYVHKLTESEITDSFKADIVPVLKITGAFISAARQRKSGKIITVLSAAIVNIPPTGWGVYVANKNYLLSMHKSWAAENKNFNISSNCISPDFMLTPLNGDVDERVVETMIARHPLKQLLTVDEVAQTVVFLCGASAQLNGQNIILNAAQF
ncbi:SDR family NAD(P)-dependent oxidoreductase [Ferruginibacter sp. SUN106]|uniref:SDR family NAD(P)-dependent oxidoreductase n=1 Tax=Ferruginibacter sp. SUN106 TaxID=2978348 RepID=UPI003D3629AE